jgi:hypothetical protein
MVTQPGANGARPPAVKMIAATVVPLRETDDSRRMPGEWVRARQFPYPIRQEWHSICAATSANCQTPILVLPKDVPGHLYAVAIETVRLAPTIRAT